MPTTVWLARHGEVHNPSNMLYGRLPRMRLTPAGRRQAEALAEFLAPRPVAAVYSSPMLRARRTAEVIRARHPGLERVRVDSDLHEILTGWQGLPVASLDDINWDFYAHPRGSDDESMRTIQRRMQRWLERMLRRHAGGEVVGVSHGDPILILVGGVSGLPLEPAHIFPRPYIGTGVVYRLQFDDQRRSLGVQLYDKLPHAGVSAGRAADEASAEEAA